MISAKAWFFLGLIRNTNPTIVVMAEQEVEQIEAMSDSKLCNSLKYYSALVDLIDHSGLVLRSPMKIKIQDMLDREIRSNVMLKTYSCDNYSVPKQEKEGAETLAFGWLDQPLYIVYLLGHHTKIAKSCNSENQDTT